MVKLSNGAYDPKAVEDEIYRRWERSGFFNPDKLPSKGGKPFTIIMPPPNANGALHVGHAVFVTLQDILVRFQRMRGRRALWLPGADHAGFETQVVFDKKLEKESRSRFQIPRDQLWQEMQAFTMANKQVMEGQLKKLGASCDWSREKFTLDPDIVKTVTATFVQLYRDGLAYRGERIVNWCVKHQTTLSDLEVRYEERRDPLYYITYGPLTLATVRPETKFGDTAVAVHPGDKRYRKYVGTAIEIETLIGPAKIKVIADAAVDPKFGTGVIKVTPAHDATDFDIGQRHTLEVRPVIGRDGRLNERTGPYVGMKVSEARKKVAEDMAERGLLVKIDPAYTHNVAVCYKCGTVVEPLVMPQWFVKMGPLAERAIRAVEQGKTVFVPERFKKVYFHWLKNIRDWNISRQISWGIRIPAWYCLGCGDVKIEPRIRGNWYVMRHGLTDWNRERRLQGMSDTPLNDIGREQAAAAAGALRDKQIDLVISSDLSRARETAEIIATALGVEMATDARLRERSFGVYEGKGVGELSEEVRRRLRVYEETPAGAETREEVEGRIRAAIHEHRGTHPHKNVLIVSHGGAIRALASGLRTGAHTLPPPDMQNTAFWHFAVSDRCACGGDLIEQDPDVLDTWFSSGQWPFATLGYPNGKDFKTFYPTDVMETGWDILFFWVARMMMLGLYRTGTVPFKTVYLHGLVRDKDRQKMSKSKGNVIDPLGVAAEYGTDALRMALVIGNLPGSDIVISEEKIRGYRNFANKLWNIHRFIVMKAKPEAEPRVARPLASGQGPRAAQVAHSAGDRRRLAELKALVKRVTADIERFRFHHAAEVLYHYAWHTFADKIIEAAKPRLDGTDARDRVAAASLLLGIHSTLLKLLHPFMPFITEELWQDFLKKKKGAKEAQDSKDLLMVESWPIRP